jgi:hypothetical protein
MSPDEPTKGRALVDPLFGEVRYDGKGSWAGSGAFPPIADTVSVLIAADETGPTEAHREDFRELTRRYAALSPDIGAALFALYAAHPKESAVAGAAGRFPRASSPEEMADLVILDWILVEGGARFLLGYGFIEGSGWDDAMFTVRVEGWVVTGESLDD